MIPTLVGLLSIKLVPLVYCSVLLGRIVYKIGGNDYLLIALSLLIILSIVLRFLYGVFWLIHLLHGEIDFGGLYHSCLINMTYYYPMMTIQMISSLINLSIWTYFIASVYFIHKNWFYLVIWARKRIVISLVLASFLVVTFPLCALFLISCSQDRRLIALDVYSSLCFLLLMLFYIFIGRKLLETLKNAFSDSY